MARVDSDYRNCPDNTVDGIQWSILNINANEPHFGDPSKWGDKCHALEIFNDFTNYYSYNPDGNYIPYDDPNYKILNRNGEVIHNCPGKVPSYIWWFETYPLEYAEFLLDTALSRGVYLQPLASNDAFYDRPLWPGSHGEEEILSDSRGRILKPFDENTLRKLR